MLYLAVDDDGIAVAGKTMLNRAGGTKILDCFYFEDPSVLPCDGSRLHVPSGVEVGVDLDIDTFSFLSSGQSCHLRSLVEARHL